MSKIVSKPSRDHDRERASLRALKAEIFTLASRKDGSFLRLARCLRMAHERDRAFYDQVCGQAGLASRKSYYLVEIAERLGSLRLPEKRFEAIGWTKAQVIAKHMTKQNALSLIQLAEQNSIRDLELLVEGKQASRTHCVLMYLTPFQYRTFEKAIRQHGAVRRGRGLVNKEEALLRLIAEA